MFIQMEDEIASMGAVVGGSLAGVKSMTATSGPGFSLMQENLGFACIAEVPCVVVNVMRGGPSTGLRPIRLKRTISRLAGARTATIRRLRWRRWRDDTAPPCSRSACSTISMPPGNPTFLPEWQCWPSL
jgi:hypothetical protein